MVKQMIDKKDILADLHTHTIFSLHALSTVKENVTVAKEKGLKYIAITDHFIGHPDDINRFHQIARFTILNENKVGEVYLLPSAEFNIGQNVYSERAFTKTKWRPIGLHGVFLEEKCESLDDLYSMYEKAVEKFTGFVHIEREIEKYLSIDERKNEKEEINNYLKRIVDLAKENNIYLEVNELSLNRKKYDLVKYWLTYAKTNGNYIYLGTDSHYCDNVGNFEKSIKLLNEIDFPKDRILNCREDLLNRFIGE